VTYYTYNTYLIIIFPSLIILKRIFKKWDEGGGGARIGLIWFRIRAVGGLL